MSTKAKRRQPKRRQPKRPGTFTKAIAALVRAIAAIGRQAKRELRDLHGQRQISTGKPRSQSTKGKQSGAPKSGWEPNFRPEDDWRYSGSGKGVRDGERDPFDRDEPQDDDQNDDLQDEGRVEADGNPVDLPDPDSWDPEAGHSGHFADLGYGDTDGDGQSGDAA